MTDDDAAIAAVLTALQNELASIADASVKFSEAVNLKLQTLETAINKADKTQVNLVQTVAALEVRIGQLQTIAASGGTRMSELNGDINNVRGEISALRSDLTRAQQAQLARYYNGG
jgi:peptidoglycan hydrolase CwlO-like protein